MFQKKLSPKGVLRFYAAMVSQAYKDRDYLVSRLRKTGKASTEAHKNFESAVDYLYNLKDLEDVLYEVYKKEICLPVLTKELNGAN